MSRCRTISINQRRGLSPIRISSHQKAKKSGARKTQDRQMSCQLVCKGFFSLWLSKVLSVQSLKEVIVVSKVVLTLCQILNPLKNKQKNTKSLTSQYTDQTFIKWQLHHKTKLCQKSLKEQKQLLSFRQRTNQRLHGLSSRTFRMRKIETSVSLLTRFSNRENQRRFLSLLQFPKDRSKRSILFVSSQQIQTLRNLTTRHLLDSARSSLNRFLHSTPLICSKFRRALDHSAILSKFLN